MGVSGPPGSGKTTLAGPLARGLGLPLLAKDVIKEALMDALPPADIAGSRALGKASLAVMFALAATSSGAVLESNWRADLARPQLAALPGPVIEVFCRCEMSVARQRYLDRAAERHPGHFDAIRDPAALYTAETTVPVAGGWPVIEVDTTVPLHLDAVIERILAVDRGGPL